MNKRKFRNGMLIYLLILVVAFILINRWMQSDTDVTTTYSYVDLTNDLDEGNVSELVINQNAEIPTAVVQVGFTNGKTIAFYAADVNEIIDIYNKYQEKVDAYNSSITDSADKKPIVKYSLNDVEKTSIWSVIIRACHGSAYAYNDAVHEISPGRWWRRPDDELWQEQSPQG